MPSVEFSVPELAEISDAISLMIRKTLADGDADGHEKKYGTLTLLQEAQAKILPVTFGFTASDTSWAVEQAEQIKAVRRACGLPYEATDGERSVWAATLSKS